jgi:hypothetical protein
MFNARSRRISAAPLSRQGEPATDLTRIPWLGPFLLWRHARTALQVPGLVIALAMVLHGLFGPSLAPKNLATVLGWVHVRGALVLTLLVAGNFFCMACPFMLPRDLARRLVAPTRNWPRPLRNKWLSIALFVLILFLYELFDLWSDPRGTALLILAYFAGALVVDSIFRHASFCKFVCPIGQFNFVASTASPLEVKVRDRGVCDSCRTKDCIRGRREPRSDGRAPRRQLVVLQRGCELALFQPAKVGNLDCTFCLDCVHACPHDNVGVLTRLPGEELMTDPPRSGIGHLSRRPDMASLTAVFAFGALLNAFSMVSPVYAVESWLASTMQVQREAPVLAVLFAVALVVEPLLVLGLAGWLTRRLTVSSDAVLALTVRYAYSLAPLGFGVWLAHYSFHFLTGFWTFVPVVQSAAAELFGSPVLGAPLWTMVGMPAASVYPIELGLLALGLLGSFLVAYRLAERHAPGRSWGAFAPWATLALLMWLSAMWLLAQPMEMRGTILAS